MRIKIEFDLKTIANTITEYLDEGVSFLFVTYNRAPNSDFSKNPITWAFQSLLDASEYIKEYIVVIDGSEDYTLDNLKWLKKKYNLNIRWLYRKNRKGCSFSRKEGIEMLNTELFFMGDDDCLFSTGFVLGSLYYLLYLEKIKKIKVSLIQQPVFDLSFDFRDKVSEFKIGKTDFENTWFYHNFDCVPDSNCLVNFNGGKLISPVKIETFKGVNLVRKSSVIDAGSFLDLSMWPNDYSEHIELSTKMLDNGCKMFYIPDYNLGTFHLKFGSIVNDISALENKRFANIGPDFHEMLSISNSYSVKTGCRVNEYEFLFSRIGSFLVFYLRIGELIALKYLKMEYAFLLKFNDLIKRKKSIEVFKNAVITAIKLYESENCCVLFDFREYILNEFSFKI